MAAVSAFLFFFFELRVGRVKPEWSLNPKKKELEKQRRKQSSVGVLFWFSLRFLSGRVWHKARNGSVREWLKKQELLKKVPSDRVCEGWNRNNALAVRVVGLWFAFQSFDCISKEKVLKMVNNARFSWGNIAELCFLAWELWVTVRFVFETFEIDILKKGFENGEHWWVSLGNVNDSCVSLVAKFWVVICAWESWEPISKNKGWKWSTVVGFLRGSPLNMLSSWKLLRTIFQNGPQNGQQCWVFLGEFYWTTFLVWLSNLRFSIGFETFENDIQKKKVFKMVNSDGFSWGFFRFCLLNLQNL